ncbi:uncharacterized protein LOC142528365 [Primulina tabacum]|uniref:uncharacterized protein LOC142528365 n=1 Tax=Primulina tabacum TaxID=48773 RepID=UPI003F593685
MQAHLAAQDDDVWYVITDGPMKILKVNTAVAMTDGAPRRMEKPREEWTAEDKKKTNLDNVVKYILYKTLDKVTFSKIKMCKTAKEISEKHIQLYERNKQTKENKLSVVVQKFDNIKTKSGETMHEYDERVSGIINELNTLGKIYSNKEVALKVVRSLPKELEPTSSVEMSADQLSNDAMSLFFRKFGKFMRVNQGNFQNEYMKNYSKEEPYTCYNYGKTGHFITDYPKPKKDSRSSAERGKKPYEHKRRTKDDKKSFKKKHEELLAKKNKSKWAETDKEEEEPETSYNSSDDEEKIKWLMTDDAQLESASEHVTGTNKESTWYLDGGYSRHMTGDASLLSQLIKYSGPNISFGDNSKGKTVGKGVRIG